MHKISLQFNLESLMRSERGNITGIIYFDFGRFQFPSIGWSDFVPVILCWWLEEINKRLDEIQLLFMDGPFYIKMKSENPAFVYLECIESRKKDLILGSFYVEYPKLCQEIHKTAKIVLDECIKRNWLSSDVERLGNLCLV